MNKETQMILADAKNTVAAFKLELSRNDQIIKQYSNYFPYFRFPYLKEGDTKEKVDGKILVDSEFIKNRLLGDVSQLKADLKASGLDLQTISIEVRNQSSLAFDFANPSNASECIDSKLAPHAARSKAHSVLTVT